MPPPLSGRGALLLVRSPADGYFEANLWRNLSFFVAIAKAAAMDETIFEAGCGVTLVGGAGLGPGPARLAR